MKLKKIITALMAIMILSLSVSVSADFVDMPNDYTRPALERAVANGLLKGTSETEISPYDTLTRAQMGAILVRSLGATAKADISGFGDVSSKEWYYDEMSRAVAMGAFYGDGSNLNPDAEITFEEAFCVLSRVYDLQYINENILNNCSDASAISDWALNDTKKMLTGGYWSLDGEGKINPQRPVMRVEFAIMMDNLVSTYITKPGTYTDIGEGNVLVKCEGVTFDKTTSMNDIFIADSVKGTTVFDDIDIERIVIRGGTASIKGTVGNVRAIRPSTVINLVSGQYKVKEQCKDGKKGLINAVHEKSYINLSTSL